MSWYRTGTIAVSNGSTAVTGTGTAFVGVVQAGWGLVGPDGRVYQIASVIGATGLTLSSPYQGSTQSGGACAIFPTQGLTGDLVTQVQALIASTETTVNGAGQGRFGDGTAAASGIRFAADEDTGIRRTGSNGLAQVTGGADRARLTGTAFQPDVPMTGTAAHAGAVDATAGRLLKVGAFGVGTPAGTGQPQVTLNAAVVPGMYGYSSADPNAPSGNSGAVVVTRNATLAILQEASPIVGGAKFQRISADGGATWSAWQPVYTAGNILGTVGQTGAVIERGTNAGGRHVRWADGSRICTRDIGGNVAGAAAQTFAFPAAFAGGRGDIAVSFGHQTGSPDAALFLSNIKALGNTATSWAVTLNVAGTGTNPAANDERLTGHAFGRWY